MKLSRLIPILILLSLSERILSIQIGEYNLGFFDLLIFILSIYFFSKGRYRLRKFYLIFIAYLILSSLFLISTGNNVAVTSIVTIPLKIFVAINIAKNKSKDRSQTSAFILTFILLSFCLLTISDGSNLFGIEVLNRNETILYLFSIIYLIDNQKIKKVLFLILIILSLAVQSRQLLVSTTIGILLFTILNGKLFFKWIFYAIPIVIMTYLLSMRYYNSLDSYNSRRFDLSSDIESKTRGDRIRYYNIVWGLTNVKEEPLLGHGVGSYSRNHPMNKVAHNYYVTSIYENGILGLILFLVLLWEIRPKTYPKKNFQNLLYLIFILGLLFIEALGKLPIYLILFKSEYDRVKQIS